VTGDEQVGLGLAIPRPTLMLAARVALLLLVPMVISYAMLGIAALVCLVMGYLVSLAPAETVPTRYAFALSLPGVAAGVVAVSVHGNALAAACLVALAALLIAPANMYHNGLLAGIPTITAILSLIPLNLDPAFTATWMLIGSAAAVVILTPIRHTGDSQPVDPWVAWFHASAMAAVVGPMVYVLTLSGVTRPHWIAMTMTVVLRPYGRETQKVARQRVVGTFAGAMIALGLAVVLPQWVALVIGALLLILMIAYMMLDRYALAVAAVTPLVVLIAAGGGTYPTIDAALLRVGATILGAIVAAGLALVLLRFERTHVSPDQDPPGGPAAGTGGPVAPPGPEDLSGRSAVSP
jgi:Fusaric acid resistance protein-like